MAEQNDIREGKAGVATGQPVRAAEPASATSSHVKPDCETRRSILIAAKQRFLHYGYKKTTIDEIATDAGVGKGTVYLYFAGKEDLLKTLANEANEQVAETMKAVVRSSATPEEKLRRLVHIRVLAMHEFVYSTPHGVEILSEAQRPEIAGCIHAHKMEQEKIFADVIREGWDIGEFTVPGNDVGKAAHHMMLAFVSFAPPFVQMCHGDTKCVHMLGERASEMLEFLLSGIRRRSVTE